MRTNKSPASTGSRVRLGAAAILVASSMLACSSEDDAPPRHTATAASSSSVGAGGEATGGGGAGGGGAGGSGGFVTAEHEPFPQLENSGGPILEHVQLVTVSYPEYPLEADVQARGDWMVDADWLLTVGAEYGVGKGDHVGKVVLP